MDEVIAEQLGRGHPLAVHLDDFLTDKRNAGASGQTIRAYRGDLLQFTSYCDGDPFAAGSAGRIWGSWEEATTTRARGQEAELTKIMGANTLLLIQ
ncbi:hypothetical protein ABZ297_16400 [Nonomuraea sp. NPDC005983]|uniref:hypothetical protein n=1 Tax=Nonomuraea sp. NPDC005983 TaxID=3155595 RepID=UPI0033AC177E